MRRAWILLLGTLIAAQVVAEPALINGGFEQTLPGGPQGWSFDHWQGTGGAVGSVSATAHGGKQSVLIDSVREDDARFIQIVAVNPSTWYRFSAWIKTQNVDTSRVGAHLSVMGAQQAAPDVRGTQDWTKTEIAFHTAADQRELTLALRLGFYGATTTGRAWFDDVSLAELPPAGLPVLLLKTPSPPIAWSSLPETLAASLLYLLVWWLARRVPDLRWTKIAAALGAVLAAKLAVSAVSPGYPADVSTFSAWALDVFRLGPSDFYREGYFADYPPGYLYVLWVVGAVSNLFHIGAGSPAFLALLKLPAVLADLGGVLLLWRLGRERSALAPLLWLLSPLAFLDSAVWGQVDSVFSLALLGAFALLELRRLSGAALLLAVAVLLKPQALLFAPLALLWLASERPPLKTLWKPLVTFAAAVLLVLPFTWNKPPMWIFGLYAKTLGSYDFASLNAANLWYLLGLNWVNASEGWGLSYTGWGWVLTGSGVLALGWGVWKSRLSGRWLFAAFGISVLVFAFSTRMHERYLFPAALLGLGAYQLLRDRRLLWASLAAGLITFADALVTLETMWGGTSAVASWHPVMLAASAGTLALAVFTLYLAFDLLGGRVLNAPPPSLPERPRVPETQRLEPPSPRTRLKAALAVAALTLAYAVAALVNLGSASSPQRFWEPRNPGEAQTFDLGTVRALKAVEYHLGLGSGQFSLEYSSDGLSWKRGLPIVNDNPYAEFRWRTLEDPQTARFVRISLVRGRQQVNELALVDTSGAFVNPAAASQLFDEPSTRVAVSDYSNGMYFDEVYFARSGWEIVQGREATENTHPPLGKVVLAGSISLLGMNPLAWRLPGTLFGIAMIPLLYLLAFRLFGSRLWAWLAALFLAVDFLHFTQTRIGTVDGYVMLFALSAYYWMVRWYQDSRAGGGGLAPGWSLLFSGISIALAIATKWIGLYAALGLAALFVGGCAALGRDWLRHHGARTLAICLGSFAVVPIAVYIASYIPQMLAVHGGLQAVLDNQTSMWNYHSQMKATHPFSSPWYQWPLMVKPIWYYSGSANVSPELASTIVALGNPLVWWGGSAAFLYAIVRLFRHPRDIAGWFIVVAGLAQYLPWAVIPRKLVFLYHFFMTVPFLILALTLALRDLTERLNGRRWPAWVAGSAAVALFALYFPVLGGTAFPRWWAEGLRALGIPVYF